MNFLITGAVSWSEEQKRQIENLGHKLFFVQDERIPLKEQGIVVDDIEGVICNGLFLYNEISDFKSLKYIQLTSAGFDRVPMKYVQEQGIEIYGARGVYSIPMAEFVISGVLQLYKQSRLFYRNQKQHKWIKNRDVIELAEKQVCIVGCGNVGQECAKRFQAFGCQVIGVDLFPFTSELFTHIYNLEQLDSCLKESDIVVLTLPLNDDTKHFIDTRQFEYMKNGSILVNIARGGVVNTKAMINALKTKLQGAVLDVFEEEPLNENSLLWDMENVILTPHNSFVGEGNRDRLQEVICAHLKKVN